MSRPSEDVPNNEIEQPSIGASYQHSSYTQQDRRHTIPASSVYSNSPRDAYVPPFDNAIEEEDTDRYLSATHLESGQTDTTYASSDAPVLKERRRRRRRRGETLRQKIAGKKILSVVFAVTILASVITCK